MWFEVPEAYRKQFLHKQSGPKYALGEVSSVFSMSIGTQKTSTQYKVKALYPLATAYATEEQLKVDGIRLGHLGAGGCTTLVKCLCQRNLTFCNR